MAVDAATAQAFQDAMSSGTAGISYDASKNLLVDKSGNALGTPQDFGFSPKAALQLDTGMPVGSQYDQASGTVRDQNGNVIGRPQDFGMTVDPQGNITSDPTQGISQTTTNGAVQLAPQAAAAPNGLDFGAGVNQFTQQGLTPGGQSYEGVPTQFLDKNGNVAAWYGTVSSGASQNTTPSQWGWHTAAELTPQQGIDSGGNVVTINPVPAYATASRFDAGAQNRAALAGTAMVLGGMAGAAALAPTVAAMAPSASTAGLASMAPESMMGAGYGAAGSTIAPGAGTSLLPTVGQAAAYDAGLSAGAGVGANAGEAVAGSGLTGSQIVNGLKQANQVYGLAKNVAGVLTPASTPSLAQTAASSPIPTTSATAPATTIQDPYTVAQLQGIQGFKTPAQLALQTPGIIQQQLAAVSPNVPGLIAGARA